MDEFLKELTELSKKHNLVIGGCGCCGSPWVEAGAEDNGRYVVEAESLRWTTE